MKILIDTHIFLWALADPQRLSEKQRTEIESPTNIIYLSAISIAEIMIKASLKKLDIQFDPLEEAKRCGFEILDFSGRDALWLGTLPFHHKDPFDRMIIAQSLTTRIPIMTEDHKFKSYDCRLV